MVEIAGNTLVVHAPRGAVDLADTVLSVLGSFFGSALPALAPEKEARLREGLSGLTPFQKKLRFRLVAPRSGAISSNGGALTMKASSPWSTFAFGTQGLEAPGYSPVPLWGREQTAQHQKALARE